jgi:class 3 adenylate cyclase
MCEMMFTTLMKARHITIDATVLFADLRGYTALSQSESAHAVSRLLDEFYDHCAEAIWEHDGLLNKTIGDAVMAVFNFPIRRSDHTSQALLAAREIQRRGKALGESLGSDVPEGFGVGVGIDCGAVSFGEFGRKSPDLTAIGTVVNLAARAQAAAKAGEILVTRAVREREPTEPPGASREYTLKGFQEPLRLWAAE